MRWKRFHWAMPYRDAGWNPTIYGLWTTSYSKPLKQIVSKQCIAPWMYHMGVSENSVPLHPMVLLIIIPTKWLFHWGYTPFSDIPTCLLLGIHCFYFFLVSFPRKFSASLRIPASRRSGKPGLKDVHSRRQASSSWPEAAACPSWWTRYNLKYMDIFYI